MLLIITLTLAGISPALGQEEHVCKGTFETESIKAKEVDSKCHDGLLTVDSRIKIAIPKFGDKLVFSWITPMDSGVDSAEITIDHTSQRVMVASKFPQVSGVFNQTGAQGSYPLNNLDSGCAYNSYSFLSPFSPYGVEWYYNDVGEPSGQSNSIYRIGAAFAAWKNETNRCGIPFTGNGLATKYLGRTDSPEAMGGNPPPYLSLCSSTREIDEKNVVGWGLLPTSVVAAACVTHSTSNGKWDSDIRFSTSYNWFTGSSASGCADAYDLGDIATHEVGHLIGSGHSTPGTDQVMNPNAFGCNFWNRKLSKGDLTGFKALWGSQ